MIIHPMFFYLMHISESLGTALKIAGVFFAAGSFISILVLLDPYMKEETEAKCISASKKALVFSGICLLFGFLLPDKETLLLMQAARLTTTENVNGVFEAMKAAMDYAVTILK